MKCRLMKSPLFRNLDLKEAALVSALAFLWNEAVYYGARQIAHSWYHHDITSSIDELIPFLPWTIIIYFGCYLFWCVNYFLCTAQDKGERDRFFCADFLSKAICLVFFLLIPTTNIRPEVTGDSIWDALMRLLYQIDSADNLFPSIHCLVSWFCWIGLRKRKDIPAGYRWFSFLMAVAVCISTLTTRQHVIIDVVGGVLLAEICYWIAGNAKVCRVYSASIAWIKGKLFK